MKEMFFDVGNNLENQIQKKGELDIVCRQVQGVTIWSLKTRGARPIIAITISTQTQSLEEAAEGLPSRFGRFYREAKGTTIRIFTSAKDKEPAITFRPQTH